MHAYDNATVSIPLDNQGPVLIVGDNGSGKTTIWHALSFIMYGKTLHDARGNKATGGKPFLGSLEFEFEGHDYKVVSRYNVPKLPNGVFIWVDREDVTPADPNDAKNYIQARIPREQLLGTTIIPQAFMHTMITGTSGEQTKYLSGMFGFYVYDQLIKQLKALRDDHSDSHTKLLLLKERLDEAKSGLDGLPDVEYTDEYLWRLKALKKATKAHHAVTKYQADVETLQSMKADAPPKPARKLSAVESELDATRQLYSRQLRRAQLEVELESAETGVVNEKRERKLSATIGALVEEVNTIKRAKRSVKDVGEICDQCLRPYDSKDKKHVLAEMDQHITEIMHKLMSTKTLLSEVSTKNKRRKAGNALRAEIDRLPSGDAAETKRSAKLLQQEHRNLIEYRTAAKAIIAARGKLPTTPPRAPQILIEDIDAETEKCYKQINDMKHAIEQKKTVTDRINDLSEQLAEQKKSAGIYDTIKSLIALVTETKRDVVTSVYDVIIQTLPGYIARMSGVAPTFSASGNKHGMSLVVSRETGDAEMRFQSGGQKDEMLIAMLPLLKEITPFKSNLLVLDEVGAFLDESHKSKLPDVISTFDVPSVFVTSHNDSLMNSDIWTTVLRVKNGRIRRLV